MVAQGQTVATTSTLAIVRLFWHHTTPLLSAQAQLPVGNGNESATPALIFFFMDFILIQIFISSYSSEKQTLNTKGIKRDALTLKSVTLLSTQIFYAFS